MEARQSRAREFARRSTADEDGLDDIILEALGQGPQSPGAIMQVVIDEVPSSRIAGTLAIERLHVMRSQGRVVRAELGFYALPGGPTARPRDAVDLHDPLIDDGGA